MQVGGAHEVGRTWLHREPPSDEVGPEMASDQMQVGGAREVTL